MFAFDSGELSPQASPTDVKPIYGFGGGRRRASITAAANVEGAGSVHSLACAVAAAKISPSGAPKALAAAGGLSKLFAHSEASSRAPSDAGDIASERAGGTTVKTGGGGKKKKRKNGKKQQQILDLSRFDADFEAVKKARSPAPVVTVQAVPDEDVWLGKLAEPDWTFMKRPVVAALSSTSSSRSSSPPPRPSGLSSLLSQAHPGDLVSVAGDSDTSVSSENGDVAREQREFYEVALDEDYVNEETGEDVAPDNRRKMHADDFEPLRCLGKGT